MTRWLMVALAALFLASVVTLWLFFQDARANTLKIEVAKALLQLGVVSVLGVVVSLFTFEYQRKRQLLDQERELDRRNLEYREGLLKSTLAKTMAAYSAVKKSRRLLRARAMVDERHPRPAGGDSIETLVLGTGYDLYMDMVNDAQFELENLARDVDTSALAFTDHDSLVRDLRSMESYLGELFGEYETVRRTFEGPEPGKKRLSELRRLKEFVGTSKGSKFREQVIIPYHRVQQVIRADLLHPQLDRKPPSPDGPPRTDAPQALSR